MSITRVFRSERLPEYVLIAVTVILSAIVTFRIYQLGAIKTMVDQNSHLNLSRQVVDSMTPGISQLGFWPPLLHLLMVPYIASDFLYQSGLAGYLTLLPFLGMAVFFIYRTFVLLTRNKMISFFGALIFLTNPFVLYYTATPMMEILFMGNLFACAYFVAKWLIGDRLRDILIAAVFVSVSTISRFEGLFLIPVVGIIIVIKLLNSKKSYPQVESLMILYSLLALSGLFIIFVYGHVFGDNPLAFMNSAWSAFNQQRDYFLPTEGNALNSVKYFLHASYHLLTKPYVFISLVGFPITFLFKPGLPVLASGLILLTPFVFDFVALFRGNAIVYVPELPPYGTFFNERYGLYWAGFVFLIPTLIIGRMISLTLNKKYLSWASVFVSSSLVTLMLIYSLNNLYQTVYVDNFSMIKQSAQGYPSREQIELAGSLKDNYDYGKILMTRALHDFVAVNAEIPLKNYIHESNYKFFDQALHDPWLFARYVVMFNPTAVRQDKWAAQNEKISVKWGSSDKFLEFYSLVMENERERLYKVKDDAVIRYAKNLGYNLTQIPSINPGLIWWNPDAIYLTLNGGKD